MFFLLHGCQCCVFRYRSFDGWSVVGDCGMSLSYLLVCRMACASPGHIHLYLGLVARKPVFGVCYKARVKLVSSATEKIEISPVASLHMLLPKNRITKALIRLRECTGWSGPVLFANPRQVFSCCGPFDFIHVILVIELKDA